MTWEIALPYLTTAVGASVMYLAGRAGTRRAAWILGILNQFAWMSYAVIAHAYGFIGGSLIYASVYSRNLWKGN